MEIKPVERSRLAQSISASLLEMIKSNQLSPGQKIPTEIELAAAFDVSRNVIRESLKTLEILGLLESKVAKGTFVTANAHENLAQFEFWEILQNNAQIKELVEVRLTIEPELAYYAAKRRSEQDLQNMRDFLSGKIDVSKYNTYGDYFEYTYAFHLLVAQAAKNEIMEKFLSAIYGQIKQTETIHFIVEKSIFSNQVGHEKILNAIEKGQCDKAKRLMFDHIYPVYAFLQK